MPYFILGKDPTDETSGEYIINLVDPKCIIQVVKEPVNEVEGIEQYPAYGFSLVLKEEISGDQFTLLMDGAAEWYNELQKANLN